MPNNPGMQPAMQQQQQQQQPLDQASIVNLYQRDQMQANQNMGDWRQNLLIPERFTTLRELYFDHPLSCQHLLTDFMF
jgi:hypothetical protein